MDRPRAAHGHRLARIFITASALAISLSASAAQETRGGAPAAPEAGGSLADAPSDRSALLARRYPTLRALVIARGDCVLFEHYRKGLDAATRSPVHSVTKSVLSILVGVAIDKGYLRLDETLSEILLEASEAEVAPEARAITVRDLLTKTEGFAEPWWTAPTAAMPATQMWRWMLYRPMKYPPGTHFNYDNVGTNLLSVVLSRAISGNEETFARETLFDALHIENYAWASDAEGHLIGETDLFLTARDMAKIGLLYLQSGRWGDRQIVSPSYVRDSTAKHNDGGPPTNAAYGYLWWIDKTKSGADAFFAAGTGSQLLYVVPTLGVVVAVSAEKIPGGSQKFVNDLVLPAALATPASAPCVARLGAAVGD